MVYFPNDFVTRTKGETALAFVKASGTPLRAIQTTTQFPSSGNHLSPPAAFFWSKN